MPVEIKGKEIRYRVKSPRLFVKSTFRRITLGKGIDAIIAKLKTDPYGKTHIQAYRFDKQKWGLKQAKAWARANNPKPIKIRLRTGKSGGNFLSWLYKATHRYKVIK